MRHFLSAALATLMMSLLALASPGAQALPPREVIETQMRAVADWQLAQPWPEQYKNHLGFGPVSWRAGAYYVGIAALYNTTLDPKYHDVLVNLGEGNQWGQGPRRLAGDDQAILQAYLELYKHDRDPKQIAEAIVTGDAILADGKPGDQVWHWSDGLFMAPPILALLSNVTGDPKYLEAMDRMYWQAVELLYDKDEALFYRDARFRTMTDADGRKIFWGRGNGWAAAGLARVLENMPADDSRRARYEAFMREFATGLIRHQQPDGFWKASLLNPERYPEGEVSGTGYITYMLAWGINHGVLDEATARPAVERGWAALSSAVHPNGKLGWVQGGGDRPHPTTREQSEYYGVGAFLLVGSELVKMGPAQGALTYCNPINIDYSLDKRNWRHAADPVVVLYKDRYYLFSTWDGAGYRVSDDLVNWTFIAFDEETRPKACNPPGYEGYTACSVIELNGDLYYYNFRHTDRNPNHPVPVLRTNDPASGHWEQVGTLPLFDDPCLFEDPVSKKLYLYSGLGSPIGVTGLDPRTWTVLQPKKVLYPSSREAQAADTLQPWERSGPVREGSWMTRYEGRYYLQYAAPGTVSPYYADGILIGESPTGPFTNYEYNPISSKLGGFINSAGHSCLFQDRHGNWMRMTTMWVGVADRFERRLGLFSAGFDDEKIPFTRTDLGDYPMLVPNGPRDAAGMVHAGWWLLNAGKPVQASSTLPGHDGALAVDEDVRTWWSAVTGDAGEWLIVDLGASCRVEAIQVNFAEQDCKTDVMRPAEDYQQYLISYSDDGRQWRPLVDRTQNRTGAPHDYIDLPEPVTTRQLRIENRFMPAGGKFALRDLRIFGQGPDDPPGPVASLTITPMNDDPGTATVHWTPSPETDGYLLRYGRDAAHLNHSYQVQGGARSELVLDLLNPRVPYHFRLDAFNANGLTPGAEGTLAPWQ